MSYKNNITMIDDLPDLNEMEGLNNTGLSMIPDSAKYQKFLKNTNNNNLHASSGMMNIPTQQNDVYKLGYHNINQGSYIDNMQQMNMQHQMNIPQHLPPHISQHIPYHGSSGGNAPNSQMFYEPYDAPTQKDLNCRDISHHTSNCDVCSKLYNNDKTIYIIIICVLAIICILLLKRILDV